MINNLTSKIKSIGFILILFFFSTVKLLGQSSIEYPIFETDSFGQKVVVMTIEQAQALDNSTDLIPLFNQMNSQIGGIDSACIKVVNEKDIVIAKQEVQINSLKELNKIKDKEISNLQSQITDYVNKEILYNKEIENKNKEIDLHLNKIKKLKGRILIGGGVGIVVGLIVGLFL